MLQVVVLPPPDSMRDVEEFRRRHDPAFHRIAAHLVVVAPFDAGDAGDAALAARFDAFRAPAFDVAFGPPAASGETLCLPVADGAREWRALQDALAVTLRGAPPSPPPAAALRVGLFGSAAELELTRRSLAAMPPQPRLPVRDVVLVLEDVRGLWHEVRRTRLLDSSPGPVE